MHQRDRIANAPQPDRTATDIAVTAFDNEWRVGRGVNSQAKAQTWADDAIRTAGHCGYGRDGVVLEGNLRADRMTREELAAEMRLAGIASLDDIAWAIIEPRGKMSFIR